MRYRTLLDIFSIAATGILLALAFPGFDLPYLSWIALVPLFLLVKKSGSRRAFLSGLAAGCLFYTAFLWWALKLEGMNPVNFALGILGHAWYLGAFCIVAYYFHERIPRWDVLSFPCAWVFFEYLKSHVGFLSVPWGIVGYTQYSVFPVARIATYTGVYGVSFLIVGANTALTEIIPDRLSFREGKAFQGVPAGIRSKVGFLVLAGAGSLIAAFHVIGLMAIANNGNHPTLKIALIQGNTYWNPKHSPYQDYVKNFFSKYRGLTLDAAGARPGLILWPSSSVPGTIPTDGNLVRMLKSLADEAHAFLLVGSSGFDKFSEEMRRKNRVANSAFLFSPAGVISGRYDKIHLLPFNEYLPLRDYVKWPSWIVSPDMKDHQPGKSLTVFRAGESRFGVLICSENMWPELFRKMTGRGVDFMVGMTNELFTNDVAAHYQFLPMYVFRAIENHVSVARIDTTGVSCIIGPDGRILGWVQDNNGRTVNVEGILVADIPISSDRTFYTRHGDIFLYFLFIVLFVLGVAATWPGKREKG